MKIFITGATGFIGTHFLRCAEFLNHEVIAIRQGETRRPCLDIIKEPVWLVRTLSQVTAEDLQGCDALVHFASVGVSPKKADWMSLFDCNVGATLKLIENARIAGIRRVVVAGSCSEYGRSADHFDPIPPNAPLEPTFGYAASKAAGAIMLSAYAVEHNMELAYLRVFSAYGEGQYEENFWPKLKSAALAGGDFKMTLGEQVRDYMPVEEVAAAFWRAVVSIELMAGKPLIANIASGRSISMVDFAHEWWARLNAPGKLLVGALPYRANEVMRFVPEICTL